MARSLLTAVALLALIAGGVLLLLRNPESYSEQLSATLQSTTGYEISIEGPVTWRYWPPIALDARSISLAVPGKDEFLSVAGLRLDVSLLDVLTQRGTINISEIALTSPRVNLIEARDGSRNWALPDAAATATDKAASADEPAGAVRQMPTVSSLQLEDLALTYRSEVTGENYRLDVSQLDLGGFAMETPIAFSVTASLADIAGDMRDELTGAGQFQLTGRNMAFVDVTLNHKPTIKGEPWPGFTTHLAGNWHGEKSRLRLSRLDVSLPGLRLAMPVDADLSPSVRFSGKVDSFSADFAALGPALGVELPFASMTGTSTIRGTIRGTENKIQLDAIDAFLDGGHVTGNGTITLDPQAIEADIKIDKLTLPGTALAEPGSEPDHHAPASAADAEAIPVSLLSRTAAHVIVRIDELDAQGYRLDAAKIEIDNDRRDFELVATGQGFGGKVVLSVDSRLGGPVKSRARFAADGVNISELIETQGLTGTLQVNSNLDFTGFRLGDLTRTLRGNSSFNLVDGTLDVRPIKRMALTIDTIRGERSSVSDWPDILPFEHMTGHHLFDRGTVSGQVFNAELENISITGTGGFDLAANTVDFRTTTMFRSAEEGAFKVSEQLVGIRWPIRCRGDMGETLAELCLGEENAIASLVAEAVKQDLRRRGRNKLGELIDGIDEKVPEEYRDLLKRVFE